MGNEIIQKQFDAFCEKIRLTEKQEEDAKKKYDGVCETIHNYYYEENKYDGATKFLFGSYKKKTNITPFPERFSQNPCFIRGPARLRKYVVAEKN